MSLPALQESPGQVPDQVGLLVQSELAGVEDVHLGVRHVPAVCLGLLDLERRVVAAPYDLQWRLVLAEPVLPGGIARDVGAVGRLRCQGLSRSDAPQRVNGQGPPFPSRTIVLPLRLSLRPARRT